MIDQLFQNAAEKIQSRIRPEWNDFLRDLFSNNIFVTMSEEELQIACIKVALEALALALLIWISRKIRKGSKKNKQKSTYSDRAVKKHGPKKWNPDGTYWDEDKQKWIEPDYK